MSIKTNGMTGKPGGTVLKISERADQKRMTYAQTPPDFDPDRAVNDISDWDQMIFQDLTSSKLTDEQVRQVLTPNEIYPRQKEVLAIHWHPEWIPMDLTERRIHAMFPNAETELIIPTQHNEIMVLGDYAGAEVDCYADGFHGKVQLLLHFKAEKVADAGVLKSMLDHTFKYRTSQLFDFMDSILNPDRRDRLEEAASETGANENIVEMVRFYTARLQRLIFDHESTLPACHIKNKLLSEYMDMQRERHADQDVNRALLLLKAVKKIVKQHFPLDYFFSAREVIEEARGLGGGVVIPHPEQFWPVLLADYDVDGYEVWNPQSREYTEFLINALNNQNKMPRSGRRPLLIFMGDDTHMSIKIRPPSEQDRAKLLREVGLQPAWDDIGIRKSLSLANAGRAGIIKQYRERLG
jgi:hypothetical protein